MCDTCGESESLVLGCQCWTGAYFPDGSLIYDYTEFKLGKSLFSYISYTALPKEISRGLYSGPYSEDTRIGRVADHPLL